MDEQNKKLIEEISFYDDCYTHSLKYKQNPDKLVYYPMWTDIVNSVKGRIIELGCGVGHLAQLLIENQKEYIAGYDFSEVAINMAKKRNPNHKDRFHVKDIYKMKKIPSGHTVIATETLEHLENDLFLFGLLHSKTRFIFSVPNFGCTYHYHVFKNEGQIEERYDQLNINSIKRYSVGGSYVIFLVDSCVK